ncbi:MAG: hypothetical protein JWO05_3638 [Gemmatimonadetes bacterium]|nr:hypothetical protein [Gemmatimonadota bacterium]
MKRPLVHLLACVACVAGISVSLGAQAPTDSALRAELLARQQDAMTRKRELLPPPGPGGMTTIRSDDPVFARLASLDSTTTEYIRGVIARVGWPDERLVGKEGSHAAWSLVRQSRDQDFRRASLTLMQKSVAAGRASATDAAMLEDEIRVSLGQMQWYGTRYTVRDGKRQLNTIEDSVNVDTRRAAVGLGPLADSVRSMGIGATVSGMSTISTGSATGMPQAAMIPDPPASEPASDTALRHELIVRLREDQRVRQLGAVKLGQAVIVDPARARELRSVDSSNTAFMKALVKRVGWPGRTMVGRSGAQAAFLLSQHADADTAFQREVLEQVTAAAAKGEAGNSDVAYLTDRVLRHAGKPQRFGTQVSIIDGKPSISPVEDSAHVNDRRKAMGLGSVEDYLNNMSVMRKPPAA